jgi:phosphate butyryltransferase
LKSFAEMIAEARQGTPRRVAVAAPHDAVVIEALRTAMDLGIARPILVGSPQLIEAAAAAAGVSVREWPVEPAEGDAAAACGAVGLVRAGEADMVMKGHLNTADLLRAVLDRECGLRTGRVLSHVAVVELPGTGRLLFTTDGGINIHPDLEKKVNIIENAIGAALALGLRRPKVAVLAVVETVNPDMPATTDAAAIAEMARGGRFGDAIVDGPISFDLAVSPEAVAVKGFSSPVAGAADILVAPYIEVGNIMTKAMIHAAGAASAGVVLGAGVPIVLLSRADSATTKLNSIALGALLARGGARRSFAHGEDGNGQERV